MTDRNWTEAEEYLAEQLHRNAEGAAQKAAEGNLAAAFEEFHVGLAVTRMALKTSPDDLTSDVIDVSARLAWAEAELQLGYSDRLPDDLDGIEEQASDL